MTAAEIVAALGGRWHGHDGMARCPSHDDRTASLAIREGEDRVLVHCHAGCEQDRVIAALRDRGLWSGKVDSGDATPTPRRARAPTEDRSAAPRRIWSRTSPIAGTDTETYLRWRGIALDLPPTLRHHGALKHSPTGQLFPAMVAAVSGPDGKVQAIQRTFLKVGGAGKAAVSVPRMSLGPLSDGAVRLAPAAETLGLAEGTETALSAMEMFQIPVWATCGAERLHCVALPNIVKHAVIFADNGGPGIKAANKAVAAYTAQRRKVTLRFPPREFGDYNNALKAVNKDAVA